MLLPVLLGSCQEKEEVDPALESEYQEVQDEVARLRAELQELKKENSAAEFPPVPAVVAQMEKGLEESQAELAGLEEKRGKLEEDLKKLQAEAEKARKALEDYRKKYPLD